MRLRPVYLALLLVSLWIGFGAQFAEAQPAVFPAADRIVAIGDLHGDLHITRHVLRMARITNGLDQWAAGKTVVVQMGDVLDRGDEEQELLEFLARLQKEAEAAGGALHLLLGNHELMNARQDFRYVTEGGFADFQDAVTFDPADPLLAKLPAEQRARAAAFRPGGPFAMQLARQNVAIIVGDNLFVHGGLLPQHLEIGIQEMNRQTRRYLAGEGPMPDFLRGSDSPLWTRAYSDDPGPAECRQLFTVLKALGVRRMVVGHTVQEGGITPKCAGRVWCVDVGLSQHYGGPLSALEIQGNDVKGITKPRDQVARKNAKKPPLKKR